MLVLPCHIGILIDSQGYPQEKIHYSKVTLLLTEYDKHMKPKVRSKVPKSWRLASLLAVVYVWNIGGMMRDEKYSDKPEPLTVCRKSYIDCPGVELGPPY
jgi:hypothetical protein